jgi:hypothetical protein
MSDLSQTFEERLREIDAYLDLLDAVQDQVGSGKNRSTGQGLHVTEQQQRILHSGVYLQLYNLVESTITRCINGVSNAAARDERWLPHDLSDKLRRQWVQDTMRTNIELNADKKLESAVKLCNLLIAKRPVSKFDIQTGGGGNWDDIQIENIANRIGLALNFTPNVQQDIKKKRRDDKGALGLIKKMRNDLAHGERSFEDCGAGHTVSDLRELKEWVAAYLQEVVTQFETFVESYAFLTPEKRPTLTTP